MPANVEQYLITVSSVEVKKSSEGPGSPFSTIVTGPIEVDLLDTIAQGLPAILGGNTAEAGDYEIIRIFVDEVRLRLTGVAELVPAKLPSNRIQISPADCFLPSGQLRGGGICFAVVAGQPTQLLLDLDSTTLRWTQDFGQVAKIGSCS